jgi:hypothetical protein
MAAYKYVSTKDAMNAVENPGIQNCIFVTLLFQMGLFYLAILAPLVLDSELTMFLYAGYFLQMLACDIVVSCMLRKWAHMSFFNVFAVVRGLVGNLRKALILVVAFIGFFGYRKDTLSSEF